MQPHVNVAERTHHVCDTFFAEIFAAVSSRLRLANCGLQSWGGRLLAECR